MSEQRDGDWLRSMRRRLGMTQRALSRAIGVSPSFVGEIEAGGKAASEKVEAGVLRLLAEHGLDAALVRGNVKDSGSEPQKEPIPAGRDGGDAVGQLRSADADPLLRHVVLELTAHLRRMDENDKLRMETVQAPEARAREAAEANIKTMLEMISSSQDGGRQGSEGPPQGPTTGTDSA